MTSANRPVRLGGRQGLIALNVALLALLGIVTMAPLAEGQAGSQPQSRARGEYTIVGGDITGGTPNVVYIVDANNNEMIALRWNDSRRVLEGIGYRDLAADTQAENQGGPR